VSVSVRGTTGLTWAAGGAIAALPPMLRALVLRVAERTCRPSRQDAGRYSRIGSSFAGSFHDGQDGRHFRAGLAAHRRGSSSSGPKPRAIEFSARLLLSSNSGCSQEARELSPERERVVRRLPQRAGRQEASRAASTSRGSLPPTAWPDPTAGHGARRGRGSVGAPGVDPEQFRRSASQCA